MLTASPITSGFTLAISESSLSLILLASNSSGSVTGLSKRESIFGMILIHQIYKGNYTKNLIHKEDLR